MTDEAPPSSTSPDKPAAPIKSTKKAAKKASQPKAWGKRAKGAKSSKRTRVVLPYPAVAFNQAKVIADGIIAHAGGTEIRRLTLLEKLGLSPTAHATQMAITNSNKYGITSGSYVAEKLILTPLGSDAFDPTKSPRVALEAKFKMAIQNVPPFNRLYDEYKGKRLAAREVMRDVLQGASFELPDYGECIDIFVTNAKDLGLLRPIGGAEHLLSIEAVLEEVPENSTPLADSAKPLTASVVSGGGGVAWDRICFYVTPIGDDGSPVRKHSDLFKTSIVEPAMEELKLEVVRADEIGTSGMITSAILEHIKKSRLVIADLSHRNPNVYYEIALRHAVRLPIVQIRQKGEQIPFDVSQVNTLEIDNSDLYNFVPQIPTFISELTQLARNALTNPGQVSNPVTVFFPAFWNN